MNIENCVKSYIYEFKILNGNTNNAVAIRRSPFRVALVSLIELEVLT